MPPELSAHCTDAVLEGRLMQHVRESKLAVEAITPLMMSISGDASRVGNSGIMNGVVVLPSGVAFTMAPQVYLGRDFPMGPGCFLGGGPPARKKTSQAEGVPLTSKYEAPSSVCIQKVVP